jgi:hypothetical protein
MQIAKDDIPVKINVPGGAKLGAGPILPGHRAELVR